MFQAFSCEPVETVHVSAAIHLCSVEKMHHHNTIGSVYSMTDKRNNNIPFLCNTTLINDGEILLVAPITKMFAISTSVTIRSCIPNKGELFQHANAFASHGTWKTLEIQPIGKSLGRHPPTKSFYERREQDDVGNWNDSEGT